MQDPNVNEKMQMMILNRNLVCDRATTWMRHIIQLISNFILYVPKIYVPIKWCLSMNNQIDSLLRVLWRYKFDWMLDKKKEKKKKKVKKEWHQSIGCWLLAIPVSANILGFFYEVACSIALLSSTKYPANTHRQQHASRYIIREKNKTLSCRIRFWK